MRTLTEEQQKVADEMFESLRMAIEQVRYLRKGHEFGRGRRPLREDWESTLAEQSEVFEAQLRNTWDVLTATIYGAK